jgi:addiction module HigA family antidote
VAGKRAITADTDLRLCRYFGLSDGWWLRGQMEYDMAITKAKMGRILAAIQPRDLSPA